MKLSFEDQNLNTAFHRRKARGFSLPEVMVSLAIFLLMIGGTVAAHVFGMKMVDTSTAKLEASAEARRNVSLLLGEVRAAQNVLVGDGDVNAFTNAAIDKPQQGTALQIYPSNDTNIFVRYFLDGKTKSLRRVGNDSDNSTLVASAVANSTVFSAEDCRGNLLTNRQNNCTFALVLDFSELGGPHRPIGQGKKYTSYRVRSKLTRRNT